MNSSMAKTEQAKRRDYVLPAIGLVTLLATITAGYGGWGLALFCLALIIGFEIVFAKPFQDKTPFQTYLALLLSPLLLVHYSSITDFRIRVLTFLLLVLVFGAALRKNRHFLFSFADTERIRPITVWFIAFAIFSVASVLISVQGIELSGDEPHYVAIAQSIVDDGDFNLKNNFDEKTYRDFVPVDLRLHGSQYNGKALTFHLPGVSFLLVPFYWLFKILGLGNVLAPALFFRLAASLVNAFFALCLFYILKFHFPGKKIFGFWLLFTVSFPLVFHSVHLYPELPAATLMMAAYIFAFTGKRNLWLAGFFLSGVLWFHVKYIPAMAVMGVAIIYPLIKSAREKEGEKFLIPFSRFIFFPALVFILLLIYTKSLYGSFNPMDIFPRESYWDVPWLLRLKVFLSFFLDQRDGLLFYSPLFFVMFFSFRGKWNHKNLFLWIASVYVFFHAFTTVRGAYAPAGRPLMFVSWVFILFIARFYFERIEPVRDKPLTLPSFNFRVLAGLGFFILVWLFYYPLFVYQPVFAATVNRESLLNLFLGSSSLELWTFFPSFLTIPPSFHTANFIWVGFILTTLYLYYRKTKTKTPGSPPSALFPRVAPLLSFLLLLGFGFIYAFYPHVHLSGKNKYTDKTISFFNNSRNFSYIENGKRKGFRIKSGNDYDIFIDPPLTRNDTLTFSFHHTDVTRVKVRNGKQLLFVSSGKDHEHFMLSIPSLSSTIVAGRPVFHIGIETQTDKSHAFIWMEIH